MSTELLIAELLDLALMTAEGRKNMAKGLLVVGSVCAGVVVYNHWAAKERERKIERNRDPNSPNPFARA